MDDSVKKILNLRHLKDQLQQNHADIRLIQHFKDPNYVIENGDGLLFAILKYKLAGDIHSLLNQLQPIEIRTMEDFKCAIVSNPQSVYIPSTFEDSPCLTKVVQYCKLLPSKNEALLSEICALSSNTDFHEIYSILRGDQASLMQYCNNWLEFAIGLLIHAHLLPEQLYNTLIGIPDYLKSSDHVQRIGISYLQVLKKIFLFDKMETVLHYLSPSDAFLMKYIVNYIKNDQNFSVNVIHDVDFDWRCIASLLRYKEYKTALIIANNIGKEKSVYSILPKIPMADDVFVIVEKMLLKFGHRDLLGFWYHSYAVYKHQQEILHDAIKYCCLSYKYGRRHESDNLAGRITNLYLTEKQDELEYAFNLITYTEIQEINHFDLLYHYKRVCDLSKEKNSNGEDIYRYMLRVFHLAANTNVKDTTPFMDLYFKLKNWPLKPQVLVLAAMSAGLKSTGTSDYKKEALFHVLDDYTKSSEMALQG